MKIPENKFVLWCGAIYGILALLALIALALAILYFTPGF